ncbi:MAG: amylo-alpha-1,6-glucosidase [Gemmatimonadota bacterium]
MLAPDRLEAEWLETDGLGGFASGTVAGWRTRRYHGLLTPAIEVPSRRAVLVDGFEAWIERDGVRIALTAQQYVPDVVHPDGQTRLVSFRAMPWPLWTWRLDGGLEVTQEIVVPHDRPSVVVRWRLNAPAPATRLIVRPLLSGRDTHALHYENPSLDPAAEVQGDRVRWRTYPGMPTVLSQANANYSHAPEWYRNFLLAEERNRGFDHRVDLWSPGELCWDLSRGDALWLLSAEGAEHYASLGQGTALTVGARLFEEEQERRAAFRSPLELAGDAYLVRRGKGKTIIAGYPWFTDWGRDTFIALRGLCLAAGRLDDARDILLQWAGLVSEGMLPNRFIEGGDAPEFNSVDASLWYVIAVHEFLQAMVAGGRRVAASDRQRLVQAVEAILEGYSAGTRYGIRMEPNGLLAAGVPGVQLTWMDAKVGDWVVTPRIGKPVEVQALWINALQVGAQFSDRWGRHEGRATAAFRAAFWNPAGYLNDVVDAGGESGVIDASFRPNQIFAVGGLPSGVIDPALARQVVDRVEARLWTPMGLRSLAPGEPGYTEHYSGGPVERDGAYHMGTVWPWLAGPFIEAWVRVRGGTAGARREARQRFFEPLMAQLDRAGLGHLAEIADAEAPFTARGCPFQAWSMGELLRLDRAVLAEPAVARRSAAKARR